jgi:hypothetical protein
MYLGIDLSRKRLEILKDSVPGLRRVAVLTPPTALRTRAALQEAAATLGLTVILVEIPAVADIEARVATVAQSGAQAILWVGGTLFGDTTPRSSKRWARPGFGDLPQSGYARTGGSCPTRVAR